MNKTLQEAMDHFHKESFKTASENFLTIGELVDLLRGFDQESHITGVVAEGDSYRGSYDYFYLETFQYDGGNEETTVGELLNYLEEEVLGHVFTGYKGGDYTMVADTPIFLSTYGTSSGHVFLGAKEVGNKVYPILMDYWAAFE